MPSFRISITASRRAAARFVTDVRRKILQALEEENNKRGLKQTDIARTIGVHRSVINRELRGKKDITLGRVAELASAMGRVAILNLPQINVHMGANVESASSGAYDFDFRQMLNAVSATAQFTNFDPANNNFAPRPRVVAL